MSGRWVVTGLAALFLIAIPVVSYWAYDYAYCKHDLYKQYRWLSNIGRYLRLIAGMGICIWIAGWGMLFRYAKK